MLRYVECWLGVDVGGKRKGFDVALIGDQRLIDLQGKLGCEAVVAMVDKHRPKVVAIDSPSSCAAYDEKTRECERLVNDEICRIRWTPDDEQVRRKAYYDWIVEGLALYAVLTKTDLEVIEVFPTASWTRWFGKRVGQSRAAWSRRGLLALSLGCVPQRTNQDQRDAIAAAVTARQHTEGLTTAFDEIVVPADMW